MLAALDRSDFDRDAAEQASAERPFIDTPHGLFTASGTWFHATEASLRDYAEPVVEAVGLAQLVAWAERWLAVPTSLALWTLPPLLWLVPWWAAALGTLGVYAAAFVLTPAAPTRTGLRVARVLNATAAQAVVYVAVLSALGMAEQHLAVAAGLAGFALLRWGVVTRLLAPVLRPVLRALYPLPRADQVLRALIVRIAHNRRLPLPALDALRDEMIDRWTTSPSASGHGADENGTRENGGSGPS
jgi:hypothetical protein